MADTVKLQGIMEQGYGLSPKLVMRDKELTIEAKAIYAYMSSFAGNGESAFPKITTICRDLAISEDRFRKHRELLLNKEYITIERNREQGKFYNNVYIINHTVPLNHGHGKTPAPQNLTTNNNKELNNNSISNSGSSAYTFYQDNFGTLSPFVAENIEHWINDLSEELVIESMKLAAKAHKRFNYAEGILKDWYKNNIRTLDDVKAKEMEFENNRTSKKNNKDRKVARF